jgi:hypothetical protein
MDVVFEENKIFVEKKLIRTFPFSIKKAISFQKTIVVCLKVSDNETFNENVFGVNYSGECLWKVEKKNLLYENSPYIDIKSEGEDFVRLFNWDGTQILLNAYSGQKIEEKKIK